jgi:predicted TIM-barrel fold metal-dependent hydrolase
VGRLLPVALAGLLGLLPIPARAQVLPIFDAHIHYSEPDWDAFTPERALSILARANVFRALVSSTPDEGTLRLYQRAPRGIVPFLRPYRTRADTAGWTRDPAVAAYVEERLKRRIYRGIGEFHLGADDVEAPVVRRLAELAERDGLYFQAHADETAMERLLARYPRVRMIWAHAGLSAAPAGVERLLDRFATLWVELSLRTDVAPDGRLDPAWRALFLKHPDRFMVGTDTWVTARWESLPQILQTIQQWLAQLPRDVAERIAFTNGDRLFPVAPAGR